MKKQDTRRRIRLRLAPPGSRRDRWFRNSKDLRNKTSQRNLASIAVGLLPSLLKKRLKTFRHRLIQKRLVSQQSKLQEIVRGHPQVDHIIVFPPSLDWQTDLFQRPQQLALELARHGALVFYVQPAKGAESDSVILIEERLYLCNVLVDAFWIFDHLAVYILTWNRGHLSAFRNPRIIYDYVDDLEVFEGEPSLISREHQKLVRKADLLLATSERLHRQVATIRPDALLCPNGVNYDYFAKFRRSPDSSIPTDLEAVMATGKPIIGYYGAFARWFDYDLVESVAHNRPDLCFVLIGPDFDQTLPTSLLNLPNICWLGSKDYSDLPAYLHFFSVATIPFKINPITHAVSPIKLFEYMAAGKPTVITPMQESVRYPGVLVARDAREFAAKLDEALLFKDDPRYLELIDSIARENTWAVRAEQIISALAGSE